jgi:hypothetical protein
MQNNQETINKLKFDKYILKPDDVALIANKEGEMFLSTPEDAESIQHCQLVVAMLYIMYSKNEELQKSVAENIEKMINETV